MEAPQLLLVAPLVLALISFPLRRWPRVESVSGAGMVWLLALILNSIDLPGTTGADGLAANNSWNVYGYAFGLSEQAQLLLVASYLILGIIFLLTVFYRQNAVYIPVALLVMAPLSGMAMVSPFGISAVLLFIAAALSAVLIQGNRAGSTLAALRHLSLAVLAMALLLSASWMLGSDQFQFLDNITSLIMVALLLLTASFPFQIWVAPVVRESSSLVPAVVFGIGHLLIVAFGLNLLLAQPFVYGSAQFQNLVSASAAATLILGGLLAITARSFGHLLGYLLLISIGAVSAVLASGGAAIVPVAMTLLILRIISLTAAGAGLAMIRSQALTVTGGANQFAANRGLVWHTPLGLVLFVFGGLSVIGLPLTPGFAGTWPAVLLIAQRSPWLAAILVLAIAAGALGVFRRLIPLLDRSEVASDPAERPTRDRLCEIVAAILLVLGALLTLFPQFASTFGESLAALF